MDFTNRGQQQTPTVPTPENKPVNNVKSTKKGRLSRFRQHPLLNLSYLTLLFSVTVILVGVVLAIFFFDNNREQKYVDDSKYQAVFLNGGQVYFGKITDLNNKFITLNDIYYLQVAQQVQPKESKSNNFTLAKLGCELHRPTDVMVINRDQVIFWENLKNDTAQNSVPGAIKAYQASNPSTDCTQQQQQNTNSSSSTSNTTNNAAESSNSNNTNNANSTTDNTTNNSANNSNQ